MVLIKIFKLSLKFLVLSLTDVEREAGGKERAREKEKERGKERGRERGRVRGRVRGEEGRRGREKLILALV